MISFSQKDLQVIFEKIISLLNRRGPALLGGISLEIGYSLETTESFLFQLEDANEVRKLTQAELQHLGYYSTSIAYTITDRPSLRKAYPEILR